MKTTHFQFLPLACLALFSFTLSIALAEEQPAFSAELFSKGTLVYADDFDGELNRDYWGAPKGKTIADGVLTIGPQFTNREEAMAKLKRDHHLGLEPVGHINKIPEKFVCHMRYKVEKEAIVTGRPSFQIGHHMISLGMLKDGGHRIKLPDGPTFSEPESTFALNEWNDIIIEYQKGKIRISINGYSKTYEHEAVTIENPKDKHGPRFTFKGGEGSKIHFDSVRLWDCTK